MCGIAGTYGKFPQKPETSLDLLAHRGPDGRAMTTHHDGYLGHARLAIVDVAGGSQPMSSADGTCWLVCNGEIYNHRQLRAEYREYPFKTGSDSEVILAIYQHEGPAAFTRLDGMFAVALLDERAGLVLARDPLGIKPLYYGWVEETLYFASEIKALQNVVPQVHEFPPGHWYTSVDGFVPYDDVARAVNEESQTRALPPTSVDLRIGLQKAVQKRLMSDVPLGVFLSGGLDSSIISALVCENLTGVHSFAVGMRGSDDLEYARHAARFLGTQHHEYVYTAQEMLTALPEVIYYLESFDPALVRSAIANYFLARLASDYVTVVLSGEGADELYSGYSYLKQFKAPENLRRELVEITAELHNRNLQRLDRMTMAHGLEGRVPFLDRRFVELSFTVPVEQKLYGAQAIEKWALRKAFEDRLPEEIVWRSKIKFSKGAGSAHVFARLAESEISARQFMNAVSQIQQETGYRIKSKEELYYYRVFRNFYHASTVPLVGHSRSL